MSTLIASALPPIFPSFTTVSLIPAMPGLHRKIGYGSGISQLVVLEEKDTGIFRVFDYDGGKIVEFQNPDFKVYQCDNSTVILFDNRDIAPICYQYKHNILATIEDNVIKIKGVSFTLENA